MKQITMRISKGKVTVETEGFGGESCRAATESLEARLGKVTADDNTPDYEVVRETVTVDHGVTH